MNNNKYLISQLSYLGLTTDESAIYLELLQHQRTHLELARKTGVNRTKVYRIAEDLEKRSLISKKVDDRGTFLIASDPTTLEISLESKEERLKAQRNIFNNLLPQLNALQTASINTSGLFEIKTYEGVDGMKQMLWHELKADGEILFFGSTDVKFLTDSKRLAERHRAMSVASGYKVREISNNSIDPNKSFTEDELFKAAYEAKHIPKERMCLEQNIAIYNNTVAVYHWRDGAKVGYEVVNKAFAAMWRQLFEHYWKLI